MPDHNPQTVETIARALTADCGRPTCRDDHRPEWSR